MVKSQVGDSDLSKTILEINDLCGFVTLPTYRLPLPLPN
jgi:hypothetical protein